MPLDPKVQAASKAAEEWVDLIEDAHCLASPCETLDQPADPLAAYGALLTLYYGEEVCETLQGARDALAGVATPVRFSWLGKSELYSSAHEALLHVRLALLGAVIAPGLHLLNDRNKLRETASLHFTPIVLDMMDKASELRALICSERAKLLWQAPSRPESEGDKQTDDITDSTYEWADYRYEGNWLTPKYCKDRFGVTGKDLSTDSKAKETRRKNPDGRVAGGDYVYRCDVVRDISDRKSRDK